MKDYVFQDCINDILIFCKERGDSEITLEYNPKTKESKKFVNDFRKKVQVDLNEDDIEFLSSI